MATFRLTAYPAEPGPAGTVTIRITQRVEVQMIQARTTAEALAALDAFAEKMKARGEVIACTATLPAGERAPNGWRALGSYQTSRYVNLPA